MATVNNHHQETEYKGGAISPPPGTPKLDQSKKIIEKAKGTGYEDIKEKELEAKSKEEFSEIPICIEPLVNLLLSLDMHPFQGDVSKEGSKESMSSSEKSNIESCIKSSITSGGFSGLGSGGGDLLGTVQQVASKFINTDSLDGKSIINNVVSSLTGNSSFMNTFTEGKSAIDGVVDQVKNLDFANIDSLFSSRNDKIRDSMETSAQRSDPEAIVTQSSVDFQVSQQKASLEKFRDVYREALNDLIEELKSSSAQDGINMANSVAMVNTSRAKLSIARDQINYGYSADFSTRKMDASDLPYEWRP